MDIDAVVSSPQQPAGEVPAPAAAAPAAAAPAGEDIAASITQLQNVLLGTESIEKFVQELAIQAAHLIADSLSCGITLSRGGQAATVACSDDLGSEVNHLQYTLGEGPCLAALQAGLAMQVEDAAAERRWPSFCGQAAARGVRSVLALPLIAQDQTVGVLNLYALAAAAFGADETQRAEQFAETAAGALALGLRLVSYAALTEQLQASLASRAVIDQAVGIIMAQQRCTQDAAFAALRSASQHRNVKLREVAREVVADITGETVHPPPFGTDQP
jgi:transcriptional regulator with GAF, ATPase, and Fis domain